MSVLTLAVAKEYLQINHSKQNTTLQIILDACEKTIADYCGVRIAADVTTDIIENVLSIGREWIWPMQRPILSVSEVLDNEQNANTPEDPENYDCNDSGIYVINHGKWGEGEDRYKVTYKAGYDATTYPALLKLAVLKLVYACYHGKSVV